MNSKIATTKTTQKEWKIFNKQTYFSFVFLIVIHGYFSTNPMDIWPHYAPWTCINDCSVYLHHHKCCDIKKAFQKQFNHLYIKPKTQKNPKNGYFRTNPMDIWPYYAPWSCINDWSVYINHCQWCDTKKAFQKHFNHMWIKPKTQKNAKSQNNTFQGWNMHNPEELDLHKSLKTIILSHINIS
jgi:hypothetical protein